MGSADARVHIWGPETPQRPRTPKGANQAQRPGALGKDERSGEMDAAGVNRVVTVPPSWEGDRHAPALEAARLHPDRFAVMGRLQNIALKATATPCSVADPFRSLHQRVRRVVDARGPRRVCWRTVPTRLPCPYRQAVTLFTEELDSLADQAKGWIMGRDVAEWHGWSLPRH